jgi:Fe-S cluster biogenesis protein NfuA
MVDGADSTSPASEDLEEAYRAQIAATMEKEAQRRVAESHDPDEISRLEALSLVELFENENADLIPALMARLGPVRAALDGHGGALVVALATIEETNNGRRALSLVIDLDGACVSCGAAPGTLKGIQDDLLMDSEIIEVRFSSAMLEWFDELQRDFVLKHGGVVFV